VATATLVAAGAGATLVATTTLAAAAAAAATTILSAAAILAEGTTLAASTLSAGTALAAEVEAMARTWEEADAVASARFDRWYSRPQAKVTPMTTVEVAAREAASWEVAVAAMGQANAGPIGF
jgi:hypothetical protein